MEENPWLGSVIRASKNEGRMHGAFERPGHREDATTFTREVVQIWMQRKSREQQQQQRRDQLMSGVIRSADAVAADRGRRIRGLGLFLDYFSC